MRRNFKFKKRLERERFDPDFGSTPVMPSQDEPRNGHNQTPGVSDTALRLVQQIFLHRTHIPPRMVAFAGINHRDGCSHICSAIAKTLARNTHAEVCLVEANLRSPSLPKLFGTTNHHGLTDAVRQDGSIKSFAKLVSGSNMWLLSSGAPVEDVTDLIASDQFRQRLAELREEFGFVLFDAPPLTRYSDATMLGQLSDGVVLVVEVESARQQAALSAAAHLGSIDVPILAVVLNKHGLRIG